MSDQSARKVSVGLIFLGLLAVVLAVGYWYLAPDRHSNPTGLATDMPPQGGYGAIAISQTALIYGSAWGYLDSATAGKRSVEECNARVPAKDCLVRLSLENQCGALVTSTSHGQAYVVTDADKTLAGAMALAQCQANGVEDCSLQQQICGNGS
jgi:hypothetical protein